MIVAGIIAAIALAGSVISQLTVVWKAVTAIRRALWRATKATARLVYAYVKLPAHVAAIAGQLPNIRADAQLAREEWWGSSQLMATTMLDHEGQLKRLNAKTADHDDRLHRLEQLARIGAPTEPFRNPRYPNEDQMGRPGPASS